MRQSLTISVFLLISTALMGQQCSQTAFRLTQDDIAVSGPCNISLLSGDIVTVKETQGYDLSCTTTDGNSAPGTIYFTDHLTLTGNGARFCGTVMSSAFNCDPRFSMSATTATSVNDFNRFFFTETDRTTGGNACTDLVTQSMFRQCVGQPCDAPPPPPPPPPGGCTTVPLATLPAKLSTGPTGSLNTTPPLECDPDIETCTCDPNPSSPIIIDLTGDGFSLTDVAHGVKFDISGAGNPVQIAWTANSNNAFLALDRDGSGTITSGAELFGNFTSQPSSKNPNGFLALAVYDDPANGGNGDGIIDARDQIFSKLRLWVDANHDGIDQPGELHTLPEMGIYSINLDYSLSERTDQYGNVFRYKAHINQGLHGPSDVGKTAYDVFLITQ
jgi:hypothetical protein